MARHPLLVFPTPVSAERSSLTARGSPPRVPSHDRQVARLAPRFEDLRRSFEEDTATARLAVDGADPERVLVLEVAGSVEDFANAVRRIPGMQWMGEFDDERPADEDFSIAGRPQAPVSGSVYLVMSDRRAMGQLLSLWERYRDAPGERFAQGLNKFRDVFRALRDVRRWGLRDRIAATGVMEHWQDELAAGVDPVRFEAEFWYVVDDARRGRAVRSFAEAVREAGGQCGEPVTIPGAAYHAAVVRLPLSAVATILDRPELRLLHEEAVMHFRPTGQCVVTVPTERELQPAGEPAGVGGPAGDPVVALLDGLPLQNHTRLRGRLVVDDPFGWEADYPAAERQHGTSMASLILHGDLNAGEPPLGRPLYVRPVMRPAPNSGSPRHEYIPDDHLPADLIHQAVRRIKEGNGTEPAAAPSVCIISLSLGDPAQLLDHRMSAWARVVDWLAWHYNVLFLVSAGNFTDSLLLDVPHEAPRTMTAGDLHAAVLRAFCQQSHLRRLLSPAESANALTIGGTHSDASGVSATPHYRYDPVPAAYPAVYDRFGLGYRGAVKPDVMASGGRAFVRESPVPVQSRSELRQEFVTSAPGHLVACPGVTGGELGRAHHTRGTSNANALATRSAALLYEQLIALRQVPGGEVLRDENIPCLLKALLVHGAGWADSAGVLRQTFRSLAGESLTPQALALQEKEAAARFIGYGAFDLDRVRFSDDHRVTLLGCGHLGADEAHQYALPLPVALNGVAGVRRLVITLAWLTPINASHVKYRRAALFAEATVDETRLARRDANYQSVRRGTVQHEIFEGKRSVVVADGATVPIKVNCRA